MKKKLLNFSKNLIIILGLVVMMMLFFTTRSYAADYQTLAQLMRETISSWYRVIWKFSLSIFAIGYLLICVKLLADNTPDKLKTIKESLARFFITFAVVWCLHYIMLVIIMINQEGIQTAQKFGTSISEMEENQEYDLYETALSKAYEIYAVPGFIGLLMYFLLVFYTYKFVFVYIKRYINVVVLILIAPLLIVISTIKKIITGISDNKIGKWFKEFVFNVIIQTFHAIFYSILIGFFLKLSDNDENLIGALFALILFGFIFKIDLIIRKLFNIVGGSTSIKASKALGVMSDILEKKDVMFGNKNVGSIKFSENVKEEGFKNALKKDWNNTKVDFKEKLSSIGEKSSNLGGYINQKFDYAKSEFKDINNIMSGERVKNNLTSDEIVKEYHNIKNPKGLEKARQGIQNKVLDNKDKVLKVKATLVGGVNNLKRIGKYSADTLKKIYKGSKEFTKRKILEINQECNNMIEDVSNNIEIIKRLASILRKNEKKKRYIKNSNGLNMDVSNAMMLVVDTDSDPKEIIEQLKEEYGDDIDATAFVFNNVGAQAFLSEEVGSSRLGLSVLAEDKYEKVAEHKIDDLVGEKRPKKRKIKKPTNRSSKKAVKRAAKTVEKSKKTNKIYKFSRFNPDTARKITNRLLKKSRAQNRYLIVLTKTYEDIQLGRLRYSGNIVKNDSKDINYEIKMTRKQFSNPIKKIKLSQQASLVNYKEQVRKTRRIEIANEVADKAMIARNVIKLGFKRIDNMTPGQIGLRKMIQTGLAYQVSDNLVMVRKENIEAKIKATGIFKPEENKVVQFVISEDGKLIPQVVTVDGKIIQPAINELGEIVGIPKVHYVNELGEIVEIPKVHYVSELGEIVEIPKVHYVNELGEIVGIPKIHYVNELGEIVEIPKIHYVNELGEIVEIPKVYSINELEEIVERTKAYFNNELEEKVEMPKLYYINELGEEVEISKLHYINELGEIFEIPEVHSINELEEIFEKTKAYSNNELKENAEVPKVHYINELGEKVEVPKVYYINELGEIVETPKVYLVEEPKEEIRNLLEQFINITNSYVENIQNEEDIVLNVNQSNEEIVNILQEIILVSQNYVNTSNELNKNVFSEKIEFQQKEEKLLVQFLNVAQVYINESNEQQNTILGAINKTEVASEPQEKIVNKTEVVNEVQENIVNKTEVVSEVQENVVNKTEVASEPQENVVNKTEIASELQENIVNKTEIASEPQENIVNKIEVASESQENIEIKDIEKSRKKSLELLTQLLVTSESYIEEINFEEQVQEVDDEPGTIEEKKLRKQQKIIEQRNLFKPKEVSYDLEKGKVQVKQKETIQEIESIKPESEKSLDKVVQRIVNLEGIVVEQVVNSDNTIETESYNIVNNDKSELVKQIGEVVSSEDLGLSEDAPMEERVQKFEHLLQDLNTQPLLEQVLKTAPEEEKELDEIIIDSALKINTKDLKYLDYNSDDDARRFAVKEMVSKGMITSEEAGDDDVVGDAIEILNNRVQTLSSNRDDSLLDKVAEREYIKFVEESINLEGFNTEHHPSANEVVNIEEKTEELSDLLMNLAKEYIEPTIEVPRSIIEETIDATREVFSNAKEDVKTPEQIAHEKAEEKAEKLYKKEIEKAEKKWAKRSNKKAEENIYEKIKKQGEEPQEELTKITLKFFGNVKNQGQSITLSNRHSIKDFYDKADKLDGSDLKKTQERFLQVNGGKLKELQLLPFTFAKCPVSFMDGWSIYVVSNREDITEGEKEREGSREKEEAVIEEIKEETVEEIVKQAVEKPIDPRVKELINRYFYELKRIFIKFIEENEIYSFDEVHKKREILQRKVRKLLLRRDEPDCDNKAKKIVSELHKDDRFKKILDEIKKEKDKENSKNLTKELAMERIKKAQERVKFESREEAEKEASKRITEEEVENDKKLEKERFAEQVFDEMTRQMANSDVQNLLEQLNEKKVYIEVGENRNKKKDIMRFQY